MPHDMRQCASRFFAIVFASALVACSSLRTSYVKPYSAAFAPPRETPTAQYVESKLAGHEGQSGFRLLIDNNDALMSRVVLIDRAARAIDLQYYIFENDATGRLVAQRLLAAADRGVRVRLLLDDLRAGHVERLLEILDAHPNIEVRLFNPFHTRNPSFVSKLGQFLIDGPRLNRRMHNKSFIVDNTVAIVGGRNIGDAYFESGDVQHFRDLDLIAIGPVVAQTSHAFDTYWNDSAAVPVNAFITSKVDDGDMAQERAKLASGARALTHSDYADALADALPGGTTVERPGQWLWGRAALVADEPQKVDANHDDGAQVLPPRLDNMIGAAQNEVQLISAYFVPGDEDTNQFVALAQHGVHVKVLTNSLAATDEPMVHAGYARYRRTLLRGGVELYELRPTLPNQPSTYGASSGVSLHAKAVIVDRHLVFVGSMNLDLRSKLLNTEMGIVADSPELAAAAATFFDNATQPQNSFRVTLEGGQLHWRARAGDETIDTTHEPDAAILRRLRIDLLRLLPIDGLL